MNGLKSAIRYHSADSVLHFLLLLDWVSYRGRRLADGSPAPAHNRVVLRMCHVREFGRPDPHENATDDGSMVC